MPCYALHVPHVAVSLSEPFNQMISFAPSLHIWTRKVLVWNNLCLHTQDEGSVLSYRLAPVVLIFFFMLSSAEHEIQTAHK